ncbi:MAG: hypothetical protein HY579_05695 [Nitrospinae bacterium]|nr:hypothetical protein [Nitrospinota bacterium]
MLQTSGKKVAVVRCGALGDVLLLLPFLNALQRTRPASLDLITDARFVRLLSCFSCVDRVFSQDDVNLWRIYGACSEENAFFSRYDAVLAYLTDPDGTVGSSLRRTVPGPARVCPPFPDGPEPVHMSEFYLKASGVNLPSAFLSNPGFQLDPEALDHARKLVGPAPSRVWAIHPGSGGERKNWPLPHFLAVAGWLKDAGFKTLLILGPAEEKTAGETLSAFLPVEPLVVRNVPLETLAGVLSLCRGYMGNDSGITHLASIIGVPTMGIFRATDPKRWGPLGNEVRILQSGNPEPPPGTQRPSEDNHWPTADKAIRVLEELSANRGG